VAKKGHQQALWLYDNQVVEVGSSNIFFAFKDKSGQIEIATPALEDLILPGVTRDSILV
jgi:branched-chain amino acid aminotransferase